jgi:hypothetical protein
LTSHYVPDTGHWGWPLNKHKPVQNEMIWWGKWKFLQMCMKSMKRAVWKCKREDRVLEARKVT